MTREDAWAAAKTELPQRVAALRSRTYPELLQLPSHESTPALHGDHEVLWTVYRDVMEDRSLRVVVQLGMAAGKLLVFEVRNVVADGFKIDPKGVTSTLPEKSLYEFM